MTRAKKVILALICAAALCCAAIGGVLLARKPAHAAAGDVTALEIVIPDNTRFYVFEDLADVKGRSPSMQRSKAAAHGSWMRLNMCCPSKAAEI